MGIATDAYCHRLSRSLLPFTEPSAEVDLLLVDKSGNESCVEMGGCGVSARRSTLPRCEQGADVSCRPPARLGLAKVAAVVGPGAVPSPAYSLQSERSLTA